jgi:hypothetical protein
VQWQGGGCGTKFFAGFALHFEAPGKTQSPSLKFSRKPARKKTVKYSGFWFFPDV